MGAVRKGSAHFLYPSACRRNHRNRQQEKTKKPYEAGGTPVPYGFYCWCLYKPEFGPQTRQHCTLGIRLGNAIHAAKGARRGAAGACGTIFAEACGLFVLGVMPVVPAAGADFLAQGAVQPVAGPRQRATGGPDRRCRGRSCPPRCSLQRGSRACLRGCWGP